LLLERLISLFLSLFVILSVARHLMPESFGKLSYLLAMLSLVAPLMAVGLNSVISREVLKRPHDRDLIIGSAFLLRGIASLIVIPFVISLAYLYLNSTERQLFAFLALCSLFHTVFIVDFWLQAHVANCYGVILRLITIVIFSVARLVAIELDADMSLFVYISGIEIVCLGLFYGFTYHRLTGGIKQLHTSCEECFRLLRDSRWLIFSGIAASIYLKVDQVMLGVLIDDRAVGIYAAAARLSEVWYFFPTAIVVSFFPQLINKKDTDKNGYRLDLQKINDFLYCGGLVVAVIVSLCASWFLPILFGEAYEEAIPVLVVHIWASVFVFMRALLSKWLITENLLKLSMISQVLGALVNVFLNMYLIPIYGPLGAAYATVFSYAVSGYLVLFFHRDLLPMAMVVTRSIFLPIRLMQKGFDLYKN
jgi:O-antigen/teichoic acid export membrane protein